MSQSRKRPSEERQSQSPGLQEVNSHDWVCLKCNNLNFSFRKKCNRCKVQSREDNEQLLYADYYYYNHFYYQQTSNHCPQPDHPLYYPQEYSPKKKGYESEGDPTESTQREDDHLPSVSPLVKKYCSGRGRKNCGNRSLFVWKLFGEQSWSEGELPTVVSPELSKDLSLTDDEETNYDFIKSVEQMII